MVMLSKMRSLRTLYSSHRHLYSSASLLSPLNLDAVNSHTNRTKRDEKPKMAHRHRTPIIEENPVSSFYNHDPDSFGLLSRTNKVFTERYEHDEGDRKEEEYLLNNPHTIKKLSTKKYADMIKEHLEKKRIKEALDVLEVRMLQEDRAQPENYIYNLLIDGCAQVGYTKKAFSLYNDMKRRRLKVTGATYTSLFNACANSPWKKSDGLKRATHLKNIMIEKAYEPNLSNYNCMVKAFGRCGDLPAAFAIVDEMLSKRIKVRVHTLNFLLQACITDTENGFRYALLTWRKMLSLREKPNIYTFHLMLRCAKECRLGNIADVGDFMSKLSPGASYLASSEEIKMIQSRELNQTNVPVILDRCPNFLSKVPDMGSVSSITFDKISSPRDRFMLMGGFDGFVEEMKKYECVPNIQTITQIMDVVPSTSEAEEKIIRFIKEKNITTDIDFYNMLIKRRCLRYDYAAAKAVKDLIKQENKVLKKANFYGRRLKPDIITYGVWAMACDTLESAKELINEMKEKRLKINVQILGSLLMCGVLTSNIEYVIYIMDVTRSENIKRNKIYHDHINSFHHACTNILDGKVKAPVGIDMEKFRADFEHYKFVYKTWNKHVELDTTEEDKHPWEQFKINQPETYQKPTEKAKPVRIYKRKGRRMMRYRVKI